MEAAYKIGNFKFDTKEEYERALKEYDIIKKISGKVNLKDPEMAKKVYALIQKNSFKFTTSIGKSFLKLLKNAMQEEVETVKNTAQTSKPQEVPVFAIIEKATPSRNFLSKVLFFSMMVMIFLAEIYKTETGAYLMVITVVWGIIIGISNINKIDKRKKAAEKYFYEQLTEDEKKKLEEENKEDSKWGFLLVIGLVVLGVLIPPLGLIMLLLFVFVNQFPKLKWLIKNWKAGVLALVGFLYQLFMIASANSYKEKIAAGEDISFFGILIGIMISTIFIMFLIEKVLHAQFYLAIRNMASFPIMLFLFILPFAVIGMAIYADVQSHSSDGTLYAYGTGGGGNPNGGGNPYGGTGPNFIYDGQPPVYVVNAPHTKDGWYLRSMPDATVYNNLRPPRF